MITRKKPESVIIEADSTEQKTPVLGLHLSDLWRVLAAGAGVGFAIWLIGSLLERFVFGPVLCRPIAPGECHLAPVYSMVASMIIANILGLITLIRLRLYRPLLVILAAAIALWPLASVMTGSAWYVALLAFVVLWALAYGLFGWIARTKSFVLAIALTAVAVLLVRVTFL